MSSTQRRLRTHRPHCVIALLLATGLAGCGQTGPLSLPASEDAEAPSVTVEAGENAAGTERDSDSDDERESSERSSE